MTRFTAARTWDDTTFSVETKDDDELDKHELLIRESYKSAKNSVEWYEQRLEEIARERGFRAGKETR